MNEFFADGAGGWSSLVAIARWRTLHQPDQHGYSFLVDGAAAEDRLTYAELDRQARTIGAALQQSGLAGERALLLYAPGLEYVAAFFGCLYAGVVAVPAYPPNPARLNRTLARLRTIVEDAQPAVVLTTAPLLAMGEALLAQVPDFPKTRWLATDTLPAECAEAWRDPQAGEATLAFLQYTSGSTAQPKGVMLSHGNLLHNSLLIDHAFGHSPRSRGVIWLPPYHDMGLIGGIIQPLYAGFPVTLMSPVDFLQNPFRWLQAISRTRATTSGGPNFAYDLCARKITPEQRATLDLSSWDLAFNGAEAVRQETIERFTQVFGSCGFRREAFYPCYGLAEATLIVTGGVKADRAIARTFRRDALQSQRAVEGTLPDPDSQMLVASGRALPDQRVVIVHPETAIGRRPNQIGEIWVSGPSVARGYWRRPEETAATFEARLADSGDGPFLRTGDLGFLKDGELFVVGRLKDLIIIRGRNHYPQDIELTVERSHPALRPGCGAAVSIELAGEERVVVIQEVDRQYRNPPIDDLAGAIRQAVADEHELSLYAVVLVKHGSIPKTSSGKIQRHACRERFLSGELELVGSSILEDSDAAWSDEHLSREALLGLGADERRARLEGFLLAQLARALNITPSRLDRHDPVNRLGLDSLMAVELQHSIESNLGVLVPMASFLEDDSIAQLAEQILAGLEAPVAPVAALAARAEPGDSYPLSFGQQAIWFLHQLAPESAAYHIASAARIRGSLDVPALQRTLQALVDRHPALRTRFVTMQGEPAQRVQARETPAFREVDAAQWSDEALGEYLLAAARRPFDLPAGAPLRIDLLRRSEREQILLLVVHHLVADMWSLAVLAHELGQLYPGEQAGRPVSLAPIELGYADYVRWEQEMLAGPRGQQLWNYWQRQLEGVPQVLELPSDRPRPSVQTFAGAASTFRLGEELSRQLKALALTSGATLYMTLLAAFQALLYRYTSQESFLVGSPTAGRNRAGLADVVGYLVNPVALRADLSGNPAYATLLERVRGTVQKAFEHQEYPFALLVQRLEPEHDQSRSPLFQTMFVMQKTHLHGEAELSAFALGEGGAQLYLGGLLLESFPLDLQIAQLDLTLMVAEQDGALAGVLQYNTNLFDVATIGRVAGHLRTLLEGIVAEPGRPVAELPLLTASERQLMLVDWNAARTEVRSQESGVRSEAPDSWLPASDSLCIHHLFEAQVARTPDTVAVVFNGGQGSGVRGQGDTETRRHGDTETRPIPHPSPPPALRLSPIPHAQSSVLSPQSLTYRELNERANRVAHHLRSLGVGPEVTVGICVERTPDMLVGLLGVLKAGGAYVPLDPAYPRERLSFMLEDAQARVLITTTVGFDKETRGQGDKALQEPRTKNQEPHDSKNQESGTHDQLKTQNSKRPEGTRTQNCSPSPPHLVTPSQRAVVCLDADWSMIAQAPAQNPSSAVTPRNLAYVIYTSGSTGYPKGVAIEHRSTVAMLDWARGTYTGAQLAGVLASTSICFDISVFELFAPLCRGGMVILADTALHLPGLPAAGEVTLINTVPSAIAELLRMDGLPESARTINLAGEPLPLALVQELYRRPAVDQVINLYGPSEDTTFSCFCVIPKDALQAPAIGRPLVNSQTYVLDRHGQPVPIGITGEVYIGGAGLARGYLGRADLTAERFVPNPFGGMGDGGWGMEDSPPIPHPPSPIPRLYRTGDLARYRPDGNLVFLGRIDHQIKLRGYRIELGEIEAALARHPGVREAAVIIREDVPGDVRLVAYVVPKIEDRGLKIEDSGSDAPEPLSSILYPLSSELRRFLQKTLPAYMVPAAFMLLPALPLTPNGKIDRRALPAPDGARLEEHVAYVAPRAPLEARLVAIWSSILGVEQVGIYDNFFNLGGHSLQATRLVARVAETFEIDLPLRSFFEAPRIADLAVVVAQKQGEQVESMLLLEMLGDVEQLSEDDVKAMLAE